MPIMRGKIPISIKIMDLISFRINWTFVDNLKSFVWTDGVGKS
jgi:hypothetical protein